MFKSKWMEENATGIFMSLAIICLAAVLLMYSRMRDEDFKDGMFEIDRLDAEAHETRERGRESKSPRKGDNHDSAGYVD